MSTASVRRKDPQAVKKVFARLGKTASRQVAVGFLSGTMHPEAGVPVAYLAAIHTYGLGNVPQRDFMSQSLPLIRERTETLLQRAAKADQQGNPGGAQALMQAAGLVAEDAIRDAIRDGTFQPLAAATIDARKKKGRPSAKPLIDSGQMVNLVSSEVRAK